jgi:hypothetical protein
LGINVFWDLINDVAYSTSPIIGSEIHDVALKGRTWQDILDLISVQAEAPSYLLVKTVAMLNRVTRHQEWCN